MLDRSRTIPLLALLAASCGGPNYHPAQPERPPQNTGRPVRGTALAVLLYPFVGEIAAELPDGETSIAIFPALSPAPTGGARSHVNALGEQIMVETDWLLHRASPGARILSGEILSGLLESEGNRSAGSLCSESDALALAERLDVAYVVSGAIARESVNPVEGDGATYLDWTCRRLADLHVVAQIRRERLPADTSDDLLARYARPAAWQSCDPRVDGEEWAAAHLAREYGLLARQLARGLARHESGPLAGDGKVRLAVEPTRLPNGDEALARARAGDVAGELVRLAGERVELHLSADEVAAAVAATRGDAGAAGGGEGEVALEADTVTSLDSRGAQALLRTSIQPAGGDTYRFEATLIALDDGRKISEQATFEPVFSPALRREIGP